jgi:hypothetical protein
LPDTDEPHFVRKMKELASGSEIKAAAGAIGPNDYINGVKHASLIEQQT